jgi:hypothetical protein
VEINLLVEPRMGHRDAKKLARAIAPSEIAWPIPAARPAAGQLDGAETIGSERGGDVVLSGETRWSRPLLRIPPDFR